MKMKLFFICLQLAISLVAFAQNSAKSNRYYEIGPKGTDTSTFSKVFVFREADNFDNNWIGLMAENYHGMIAKVNHANAYCIYFPSKGKQLFYLSTVASGRVSVELNLTPKSVHFLLMETGGTLEKLTAQLTTLDSIEGKEKLKKFEKKLNYRYSIIPYKYSSFNSEYFDQKENIADKMKDSFQLIYDKNLHLSFLIPPRLDYRMTILGISMFGFSSKAISTTYSEVLVDMNYGKCKAKNNEGFESFLTKKKKKLLKKNKDRYRINKLVEIKKNDHSAGVYSALLYFNYNDYLAANRGTNYYLCVQELIRIIVFKDAQGKQITRAFSYSERGTENELSSLEEFLERFEDLDKSIQVHR